jgi:MFS family permease
MSLTAGIVAPFAGRLADRIGGKYLLMAGLALFGIGAAIVTSVATVNSTQLTFFLPWVLTGVGLGLVFAPMTTIAMRDIRPAMAGAASGVLNTTRQLGSVIGAAVVGAVLQNQLASALHNQAVTAAAQLPSAFRRPFVDGFAQAAKSGLQVGRGQTGAPLPANLPASVVATVQHLVRGVFDTGYVMAMRPTVGVAVAVLAVASLSCLWVLNGRHRADQAAAPVDAAAVA